MLVYTGIALALSGHAILPLFLQEIKSILSLHQTGNPPSVNFEVKIAITGSHGMLGRDLSRVLDVHQTIFTIKHYDYCVDTKRTLESFILKTRPKYTDSLWRLYRCK